MTQAQMTGQDLMGQIADLVAARWKQQGGGGSQGYAQGYKHDLTPNPTTTHLHGPGGLLSYPGVDPNVYHTIVGSRPGILAEIPWVPTVFMNPIYEVITGVHADPAGQSEPEDPCDPFPVGGVMKGGIVTAPIGRVGRRTRQLDLSRLGQRVDRAEPTDLRLVGRTVNPNPLVPGGEGTTMSSVLQNQVNAVIYERGLSIHRMLGRMIWTGNPANNTTGGAYKEFAGLELLVNTGYVDALNNTALPSLASDLKNFNYQRVESNGDELIDALTYMFRTRATLAEQTGLGSVRWAFTMPEGLFYEITKVWPCSYLTYTCDVDGNNRININAGDVIGMRDEMRRERYLLIDGIRVPVIVDDFQPYDTQTNNGNVPNPCQSADIFLLPFSVLGGQLATLYGEYFQFQNEELLTALRMGITEARILDGGMWFETRSFTNRCVEWEVIMEPRLVLRTPWLAGRLQNVVWCALQKNRDPLPSEPYYVNGGSTTRPDVGADYYTAPWA